MLEGSGRLEGRDRELGPSKGRLCDLNEGELDSLARLMLVGKESDQASEGVVASSS